MIFISFKSLLISKSAGIRFFPIIVQKYFYENRENSFFIDIIYWMLKNDDINKEMFLCHFKICILNDVKSSNVLQIFNSYALK